MCRGSHRARSGKRKQERDGEEVTADGEGVEGGIGLPTGVPGTITAAKLVGGALLSDERNGVGSSFYALLASVAATDHRGAFA
jgi:hypothetical protein